MFYIAICDDEWSAIDLLTGYLHELKSPKLRLTTDPFLTGTELVTRYQQGYKYDIVILDMLMAPLNGIETAKIIRTYDTDVPILIVTRTVEYAVEGYQVNAYRYILKPVDKPYFQKEILTILASLAKTSDSYFSFTNDKGLFKIKTSNIYYFESNMRTISVCHKNGKAEFTGKISDIEGSLIEHHFIRIHKSYVVNLKHIKNIFKEVITLDNGEELPLSKHRSKELRQLFLSYIKDTI
ncbi:MAG TPA: response regulator transcription factor [Candidatus Avacidaminococcus intestinavium]|uniref:Response regulator transcription factor n=1 Tax=Candidatus Avacidaminococcus intestinavium TaxID=2840684 RepID=A0A9D1MNC0_9FIRM|nr:response regulator transcription factor [Candidatus Avacidaminococcus intestinavium]